MLKNRFILLDRIGNVLLVAVCGSLPASLLEKIEEKTASRVFFFISTRERVMNALNRHISQRGKGTSIHKVKSEGTAHVEVSGESLEEAMKRREAEAAEELGQKNAAP